MGSRLSGWHGKPWSKSAQSTCWVHCWELCGQEDQQASQPSPSWSGDRMDEQNVQGSEWHHWHHKKRSSQRQVLHHLASMVLYLARHQMSLQPWRWRGRDNICLLGQPPVTKETRYWWREEACHTTRDLTCLEWPQPLRHLTRLRKP